MSEEVVQSPQAAVGYSAQALQPQKDVQVVHGKADSAVVALAEAPAPVKGALQQALDVPHDGSATQAARSSCEDPVVEEVEDTPVAQLLHVQTLHATGRELRESSIVVIIAVLLLAAYVGLCDAVMLFALHALTGQ